MRCPSSLWLCSLFALLSTANASVVISSPDACAIQAWVRAPDLDPGEIIPGQVRVKTKGSCNPILEYSVILRFKERVWAKIAKPGVESAEGPQSFDILGNNLSTFERKVEWNSAKRRLFGPVCESLETRLRDGYAKKMYSTMWVLAEEERVAFKTSYKLSDGPILQPEIQSIHDFALLVPTTNYPPSESTDTTPPFFLFEQLEFKRRYEHIYLYTVEIKFVNGTIIEIPAGRSSFNAVGSNSERHNTAEVVTFTANFPEISRTGLVQPWTPLNISFDIDVTFPYGRHLEQGSALNLTFNIHGEPQGIPDADQVSYNIAISSPSVTLHSTSKDRRMEMLFPGMDIPAEMSLPPVSRSQLSPTSNNDACPQPHPPRPHCCTPHEAEKSDWNTTTVPIHEMAFPSFDMYYQSIEAEIVITLNLRYVLNHDPLLASEDYPWIPIMKISRLQDTKLFQDYRKEIPIVIHPGTRKPDFQATHYLSPDARQPVFVDPCEAAELSKLSVQERDLLAPKSEPIINRRTDGDDIFRIQYNPQPIIYYVGNTWQRKVLDSKNYSGFSPCSRAWLLSHAEAQVRFTA